MYSNPGLNVAEAKSEAGMLFSQETKVNYLAWKLLYKHLCNIGELFCCMSCHVVCIVACFRINLK